MQSKNITTAHYHQVIEVKISDQHPHAYKAHLHSQLSLGIIEHGETILTINGHDYHFSEGDGVIIMPYIVHNCQPVDIDNWGFTMIYLDDYYKEALLKSLPEDLAIGIAKLGPNEFRRIKELTLTLSEETDPFVEQVEIIDCLNVIINAIEIQLSQATNQQIEKVHAYITQHFLDAIRLDDLQEQFKLNKFVLIRHFKKLYNSTPSAYQLQLKINYAKELMTNEKDLTQIALEAGFYDQAHFTREFKKAAGMPPSHYLASLE